jgi:predicted amidophosphoribosyltransferase
MTDRDYLWCLIHMRLDEEEALNALCPACRREAEEDRCPACGVPVGSSTAEENPAFDPETFDRTKEGILP